MANLKAYNKKRDFNKTKEPIGKVKLKKTKKLKFVVQHHLARKDHYDFRLEYQGVYVSFAVPKGPSFNPSDKRLAVHVEDHPLSYGNFEGIIPKGEYGGGTVMLFDKGYWEYSEKPDFNQGPIKFKLKGKRLIGAWTLVKFKEDNWLLIKERDEYVLSDDINNYSTSIKSGKTMEEIRENIDNIEITHPDKIIIKKGKITKQDLVDYYQKVADCMLPFLDNRLISTIRCPNGKETFFMKHFNNKDKYLGKKIVNNKSEDSSNDYYYIKNKSGIISEANNNSYEFHIWGSKQDNINHPDILVFDLDPDEGMNIKKVRQGVKDLKSILDELELKSYLKTSGGKGYHIVIPINTPSWKKLESIAKNISELMVNKWPDKYTTNMRKEKRKNKIFIDYFRNKKGATSVAPYSIRLRDNAPISTPISWRDLDKIKPNDITINNIDKYLKRKNPWEDFFTNYN